MIKNYQLDEEDVRDLKVLTGTNAMRMYCPSTIELVLKMFPDPKPSACLASEVKEIERLEESGAAAWHYVNKLNDIITALNQTRRDVAEIIRSQKEKEKI